MKIKVWAFVLIIVLTVAVSSAGTFAAMKGFSAVSGLVSELRRAYAGNERSTDVSQPEDKNIQLPQGGKNVTLPANFNAGVSIAGTYGELTGRTEAEVLAAAEQAGTSTWGLAYKEGKLDQLKAKVQEKVEASLKQMVTKGTVTQEQSDLYLNWVKMFLSSIGDNTGGNTSGFGQGNGNWWDNGSNNQGGNRS